MPTQVISFHYTLKDDSGQIIDSSVDNKPLAFLTGVGQIIPGLEKTLVALQKGDKRDVRVEYAEAYGPYDQKLIYQAPRDKFPARDIKVGDIFQLTHNQTRQTVTVIEIANDLVTLDANHSLAGKDLNFSIEILGIREATATEIEHGHVH